ncbi:MAG: amidoligase family protein [Hahellaceae bacterium]|nr:amidoligase family protein [Hahellaceae bacterium]
MEQIFFLPQRLLKNDGTERRVGVEIEMSGIELSMIACQINILFGGRIEELSPYEFRILATELGDFKIELDFKYLKNYARERHKDPPQDEEMLDFEQIASDALALVAKSVVPFEVITPPIPVSQLFRLEALTQRLREHGAKGTRHLVIYAFGVHLNPELPDTRVETLLAYLRAFLCLYDWLAERERVSFARKVTPFINNFPTDYIRKVLSPDYEPDLATFIDDYLQFNPTRNRVLDYLPILAWLDEARVRAVCAEEKIGKRPTLHYRLPNSDIDNRQWSISQCWNDWLQVETLASDDEKLRTICHSYLRHLDIFNLEITPWREKVKKWLANTD